ncbi:hypothetical protein M9458_055592, partial [Cirrhinus mrigala]
IAVLLVKKPVPLAEMKSGFYRPYFIVANPAPHVEDKEQVQLVAPYWPTRTWFANLMLLVTAPPWKIPQVRPHGGRGLQT